MNDFTKEELEDILWHFEYYLECLEPQFGKCRSPGRIKLMEKIQSMIEKHCDHEFIGYLEGNATVPYCNKCCKAIMEPKS